MKTLLELQWEDTPFVGLSTPSTGSGTAGTAGTEGTRAFLSVNTNTWQWLDLIWQSIYNRHFLD